MGFRIRDSRVVRLLIAGSLVVGLFPALAWASPTPEMSLVDQLAEHNAEALARFEATGDVDELERTDAYDGDTATMPLSRAALPEKLDLRERGVVTPVKSQSPFGSCWAFGAIAAAETSLMTELGYSVARGEVIDLSELHPAWFSYMPIVDESDSQFGEGFYAVDDKGNIAPDSKTVLDQGGKPFMATSVFSSGIGPVNEEDAPYKNKEGAKITHKTDPKAWYYDAEGDWSVDESLRFGQVYELEESSVLPSPAGSLVGSDGTPSYDYKEAATIALKNEILEGRAVEIGFCADTSSPNDPNKEEKYIDTTTWAHYTYDMNDSANHAVTIVGWDDTYKSSNFLDGHEPDKDGAWLVKNSWGSSAEGVEAPHYSPSGWGIDGAGYFYLSYYDRSISLPETFKFDVVNTNDYFINQYDYMPSTGVTSLSKNTPSSMVNIFETDENISVRALSCETAAPNTKVTYELYLLNDNYATPTDGTRLGSWVETYDYGGYHRLSLPAGYPVKAGQRYSVVVTQQVGSTYEVLVEKNINKKGWEALTAKGFPLKKYAVGVVNKGESMYTENGGETWIDWADAVAELKSEGPDPGNGYFDYDNFAIKAYSDPLPAAVSAVPDLSNMTQLEALAALEKVGFTGQAGEPAYSERIEKGRVMGQDVAPGTEKEEGSVITYNLSLGKEPVPLIPVSNGEPAAKGPLAATGDNALMVAGAFGLVVLFAGGALMVSRRLRRNE